MRMFRDKIGHTVEVYIDDMVVKTKREIQHIDDLRRCSRYFNVTSCASMSINVPAEWGPASS